MTRRVPVLPQSHCGDCPCSAMRPTLGLSPKYCRVLGEELWVGMPLRTGFCIADELAWRNVIAGLAMVAYYRDGEMLRLP